MSIAKPRWLSHGLLILLLAIACLYGKSLLFAAEAPTLIAASRLDSPKTSGPMQTTVLAGGCFWGVQGVFEHVKGVSKVLSGYAGGAAASAQYELVSGGDTGHAEAVQITYDPAQVSYGELLRIFFSVAHDPTQLNRQGPDTGSQYRSAIFYADEQQKKIALAYIAQLDQSHAYPKTIVTRVDPLRGFYPAEDYHQDFLIRNPTHPYILFNDLPKVENLQRIFPAFYRAEAVRAS